MDTHDKIDLIIRILQLGATMILGVITFALAVLGYRHQRQQREEEWLKTFRDVHEKFWADPDMAIVRSWIANDDAYSRVSSIFALRNAMEMEAESRRAQKEVREKTEAGIQGVPIRPIRKLSRQDYEQIERFDKFCNMMVVLVTVNPEFEKLQAKWAGLFLSWWVSHARKRTELRRYIKSFYGHLMDKSLSLPPSQPNIAQASAEDDLVTAAQQYFTRPFFFALLIIILVIIVVSALAVALIPTKDTKPEPTASVSSSPKSSAMPTGVSASSPSEPERPKPTPGAEATPHGPKVTGPTPSDKMKRLSGNSGDPENRPARKTQNPPP